MEEKVNIESFIEEMTKVRPEVLTPEAKSLFNTINTILDENLTLKEAIKDKCEIADERNQLLVENQKLNKVIDEMAEMIVKIPENSDNPQTLAIIRKINSNLVEKKEAIKQFFIKKVEEQE